MKKLTIEFCKEYAENRGYILDEDVYYDAKTKMSFIHNDCCGYKFEMMWNNFSNGQDCPKCAGNLKLTLEYCKKESLSRGYILKENFYIGNRTKMIFLHKYCKNEFKMAWYKFSNAKQGCPKCGGKEKLTLNYCKKESKKRGYLLLSDSYKNNRTKMMFKHLKCDYEFPAKWNNFSQGKGCAACARKQTESKLANELKQYFSEYYSGISEYKIFLNPDTACYLPYDIYLPNENIFIEIHGEQHYKFIPFWHKTQERFKYQKYRDKIKKKHAKKNGIYIEIDLRKKLTTERWIEYIEQCF